MKKKGINMTPNKIHRNDFLIEQKQKELQDVAWGMVNKEGGIVLDFSTVDEGKKLIEVSEDIYKLIRHISLPYTDSQINTRKGLRETKQSLFKKHNNLYVEDDLDSTEEENESVEINNELFADLQIKAQKVVYILLSEKPEFFNSYKLFKNYLWKSLENEVFDLGRVHKRKQLTFEKEKILRENYEAKDIEEQNEDYVRPFALVSSYSDLDEDDLPFKTNKNFKSEDARDPQSKYCIYESFVKYSEALNNIDLNLSEKNCIEAIKNSNNSVRINQQYKTEINSIRKKVNRYLK